MSQLYFDGLKKPTAIAKKIKALCGLPSLTESKEITAKLAGYSTWVHLKRETLKSNNPAQLISFVDVLRIAKALQKMALDEESCNITSFVAIEFKFKPNKAGQLSVFTNHEQNKALELVKELVLVLRDSKQDFLSFKMQELQESYVDSYFLARAAMFYFLAELNCHRAQLHIGEMFCTGCLGFTDSDAAIALFKEGLLPQSKIIFSDTENILTGDLLEFAKTSVVQRWDCYARALKGQNNFLTDAFFDDVAHANEKIFYYAGKLKVEPEEILAGTHYRQAEQFALLAILSEGPDGFDDTDIMSLIKDELMKSYQKGYSHAGGILSNVFQEIKALEAGELVNTPFKTEKEIWDMLKWELTGAYVPIARYQIIEVILRHAIDKTEFSLARPNMLDNPITLLSRIKDDVQTWPHLKEKFLLVAQKILSDMYEAEIRTADAIRVGLSLIEFGNEVLNQNTLTAISQHQGHAKLITSVETHTNALDTSDPSICESLDYVRALYINAYTEHVKDLPVKQEKIQKLQKLCKYLCDKNLLHPAFQLIYALRDDQRFKDFENLRDWVSPIIDKIETDYIPHPCSESDEVDKILMEYGTLHIICGDLKTALKYHKIAAVNYPSAREALIQTQALITSQQLFGS
tara:strand:+ start:798 stop:2696 length:1899 start_codon:yes stop_codon:yes gene_type:complete